MIRNAKIQLHTKDGISVYDKDSKTLDQIINDGFKKELDGDYIIHRIRKACIEDEYPPNPDRFERIASVKRMFGFFNECHHTDWIRARALMLLEKVEGNITQEDYDLIDNMLPNLPPPP